MTVQPGWVPSGIDTGKANVARANDYWLGGSHNFGVGIKPTFALITRSEYGR